jgi:hypothetical protein
MKPRSNESDLNQHELDELSELARRSGFTFDEDVSRDWLAAVRQAVESPGELAQSDCGEFGGHELAMLDFDRSDVDRLRAIGRLVEAPDAPELTSALAIAGSEAQGIIQLFPSDADYFERWHFRTESRDQALQQLADLLRKNVDQAAATAKFRLEEIFFGLRDGKTVVWLPTDVETGTAHVTGADGNAVSIGWNDAARNPGFVKIDWTLLDRTLGGPGRVSKVIDATWETPEGAIESLDGAVDADYQQIYLDRDGALLAAELTAPENQTLRDQYLRHMEHEIAKYALPGASDYAKVAKRLYNLCRLTGRFSEAVFIREMFDDTPAKLHQLRVRLEYSPELTLDEQTALLREIGGFIAAAPATADADPAELVRLFDGDASSIDDRLAAMARVIDRSFYHALSTVPSIAGLIDEIRSKTVEEQAEKPAT